MTRRQQREHLFRLVFLIEFHEKEEIKDQIDYYFSMIEEGSEKDFEYIENKYNLIVEKIDLINEKISEVSSGWKINRIGKADLAIMRVAIYEIDYDEDIPAAVAINEAVELGKLYGEESSAGFINGVLAKVVK